MQQTLYIYIYTLLQIIHYIKVRRWYSGQAFDHSIFTGHLSLFDITAEWPKTTQISTILSSDRTYNVICI